MLPAIIITARLVPKQACCSTMCRVAESKNASYSNTAKVPVNIASTSFISCRTQVIICELKMSSQHASSGSNKIILAFRQANPSWGQVLSLSVSETTMICQNLFPYFPCPFPSLLSCYKGHIVIVSGEICHHLRQSPSCYVSLTMVGCITSSHKPEPLVS